jgi:hypothetical protein
MREEKPAMHPADSTPFVVTVKLFPRLAMAQASNTTARTARGRTNHKKSAERALSRDDLRSQVRARLLRMIVDNEQVRRNEQRPTAS